MIKLDEILAVRVWGAASLFSQLFSKAQMKNIDFVVSVKDLLITYFSKSELLKLGITQKLSKGLLKTLVPGLYPRNSASEDLK